MLHAHLRDPQRRRGISKLLEGDDRGTIILPTQGCMPIKVPNYNSFCITHFEAEKVYQCVEKDQIVSPLVHFIKIFSLLVNQSDQNINC